MAPAPREVFSLVEGGPAYRLLLRLGLVKPGSASPPRRILLAILVTWVPLLGLSAAQGLAIGPSVKVPFLYDFAAYARYLVAIPLLIFAERIIESEMAKTAALFVRSRFVPERNLPDYESAVRRAKQGRDSNLAEALVLAVTFAGVLVTPYEHHLDFSSWRSVVSGSVHTRSLAEWWNLCVALPLFQFLIWRWLWRLFLWYRFLWDMSRLELRLVPTHPDRAAGLGFVGDGQRYFWTIAFAASATASGVLANEILYKGVTLDSLKFTIAGFVVVVVLVFLGPLLMFQPQLWKARIDGMHDYGRLAVTHHRLFDAKWVRGDNPKGDSLLGTPDISSLADLDNAHDVLQSMRPVPFDPRDAIDLTMGALLPMAPLLLTVMPLSEMAEMVLKLLG